MNGLYTKHQRGGTFLGFVVGLVVGLGAALAVAVYVTKVPVPFVTKAVNRTAEKDATEVQKNKDWDPNAPLYGKNPAKPVPPVETTLPASSPVVGEKDGATKSAPVKTAPDTVAVKPETKLDTKPAVTTDPLGDLVKARATAKDGAQSATEPFAYFVQVGAFRTPEDAESQRAKLSLAGVEAKISEREQAGRVVYRVRSGPFDKREDADKAKAKLDTMGMDTALVRVQR